MRLRRLTSSGALLLCWGCVTGGALAPDAAVDAGASDAGARATDSGLPDAGNSADAGTLADAGSAVDAGAGSDAGTSLLDVPPLFDATDGSPNYLRSPIPPNPVIDPNNAAMLSAIDFSTHTPSVAAGPSWVIPIYLVHDTDPLYSPSLVYASAWGCDVGGSIHIPDAAARELPDVTVGGDAWVAVVNPDDGTVRAIWGSTKSSGTWSGECGGCFPLHGNGFIATAGLGAGAGEQIGAGIILQSELRRGLVDHALYMTSTITCSTFRTPATKSDGRTAAPACLPEGIRFQLDPTVNCDALAGASAGETLICHALQTYGGYVLDSGGSGPLSGISVQGDDLTDPNRAPWQTPGDPSRGASGCTPSASCGVAASLGLANGGQILSHIPWSQLRFLAHWDGT